MSYETGRPYGLRGEVKKHKLKKHSMEFDSLEEAKNFLLKIKE